MSKKTAVVLMNLGGPDKLESVKPFLFNLFFDKAITRLPKPFRWILAKLISGAREKKSKKIFESIGGRSPILAETKEQAELLEKKLNECSKNDQYKVFVSMRYWHPFANEVIEKISPRNYSKIILLPLYPQFSTTTSESSIQEFIDKSKDLPIPKKAICCFFGEEKFLEAHVNLIKRYLPEESSKNFILLFSAHSLPEKFIDSGDPYQWQVEQTVYRIMKRLGKGIQHKITYQSKVGPLKWLGPSTEEEIINCAKTKKDIVLIPISFVSEHSETLVELDLTYKKLFQEEGGGKYVRVPALGSEGAFVDALAEICLRTDNAENKGATIRSNMGKRNCPNNFTGCINCYDG